jgi:hypothetical protein
MKIKIEVEFGLIELVSCLSSLVVERISSKYKVVGSIPTWGVSL